MKKYKIGERIALEVQESAICDDCFFEEICSESDTRTYPCGTFTEQRNVIFKEVRK